MADPHEIEALKSSFRGALDASTALAALSDRVAAIDPHGDMTADDLEDVARVALAHAVAAQALRGLVETMRTRRGR